MAARAWSLEWVESRDGTRVAVRARGEGPPLVLLPGGPGGHGWLLRRLLEPLADRVRLVSPDARGCGESPPADRLSMEADVEDLEAVLARTGPAFVLGHSYGGMRALAAAARDTTRLRGLVLVATAARYGTLVEGARRQRSALTEEEWAEEASLMGRLMRGEATPEEERRLREARAGRDLRRPEVAALVLEGSHVEWPVRLAVQRDLYRYDVREALPGVRVPALVIGSPHDPVMGDAHRAIAAALPEAELLELPGCGHHPLAEETAACLAALTRWLEARA